MKRILIVLICLLTFGFFNVNAVELPEKTDHEKVTIYLFRGHGCSHCYDALTYFNEHISEYADYIDVVAYEVWENSNNSSLMQEVASKLGDSVGGVPYIVIGDNFSTSGFADTMGESLISTALEEYKNSKYNDIVKSTAEGNNSVKSESLHDACVAEGIVEPEKRDSSNDTVIVIAIFAVIIGGGIAFVVFSRKK